MWFAASGVGSLTPARTVFVNYSEISWRFCSQWSVKL